MQNSTGERMPRSGNPRRHSAKAVSLPDPSIFQIREAIADCERVQDCKEGKFAVTVARALEILSAFSPSSGSLGNQELSELTGIPKPTVSRLTHTLSDLGYLQQNPKSSQFEVGAQLLSMAYSAIASVDIRQIAKPIMDRLAAKTDLSIGLVVPNGLTMLHIESSHGSSILGLQLFEGSRLSIVQTSTGRAYLSALSQAERDRLLNQLHPSHSHEWPLVLKMVEESVRSVQKYNFCISLGEWADGVHGASTPIHRADKRGIYCLSIGGPAYALPLERLEREVTPLVLLAGRKIASQLGGWIGPPSSH